MVHKIRLITVADLPAIEQIQDSCYSEALYETPDLLQQRLSMQPATCWLIDNKASEVLAYLFSYPTKIGLIAPLGSAFNHFDKADVLYLHDMAVSHSARGFGLAQQLLKHAESFANDIGLASLALVAVQGADSYWQQQGFQVVPVVNDNANKALASYGADNAIYMTKRC